MEVCVAAGRSRVGREDVDRVLDLASTESLDWGSESEPATASLEGGSLAFESSADLAQQASAASQEVRPAVTTETPAAARPQSRPSVAQSSPEKERRIKARDFFEEGEEEDNAEGSLTAGRLGDGSERQCVERAENPDDGEEGGVSEGQTKRMLLLGAAVAVTALALLWAGRPGRRLDSLDSDVASLAKEQSPAARTASGPAPVGAPAASVADAAEAPSPAATSLEHAIASTKRGPGEAVTTSSSKQQDRQSQGGSANGVEAASAAAGAGVMQPGSAGVSKAGRPPVAQARTAAAGGATATAGQNSAGVIVKAVGPAKTEQVRSGPQRAAGNSGNSESAKQAALPGKAVAAPALEAGEVVHGVGGSGRNEGKAVPGVGGSSRSAVQGGPDARGSTKSEAQPAPDSNSFTVQVGAFKSKKNADSLLEDLKKACSTASMIRVKGLYHVACGRFGDAKEASSRAKDLSKRGFSTYVRPTPNPD